MASPVIKKEVKNQRILLTFSEVIKELQELNKVTKKEWDNEEYWLELHEGILKIHKSDGLYYPLLVSDGDISGTDWYVLT